MSPPSHSSRFYHLSHWFKRRTFSYNSNTRHFISRYCHCWALNDEPPQFSVSIYKFQHLDMCFSYGQLLSTAHSGSGSYENRLGARGCCSLGVKYQRFEGTCYCHLQGENMMLYYPPRLFYFSTRLHGTT